MACLLCSLPCLGSGVPNTEHIRQKSALVEPTATLCCWYLILDARKVDFFFFKELLFLQGLLINGTILPDGSGSNSAFV